MENFWEHIVLCFTHTFVEGEFCTLEDEIKQRESGIKSEMEKKMEEIYKESNEKIKKYDLNKLKCLFINLCSGNRYERLTDGSKKKADEVNNKEKDKLQKIISEFKGKDPMHFSIEEEEEKDQLFFEETDEYYIISEVDFKKKIYKDYKGEIIETKCIYPPISQKEKYKYTKNIINNHKRGIGFTISGILCIPFLIGLFIPGVNACEAALLTPYIFGLSGAGITGGYIFIKGWKSTIEKIKNNKIQKLEDLKNNKIINNKL